METGAEVMRLGDIVVKNGYVAGKRTRKRRKHEELLLVSFLETGQLRRQQQRSGGLSSLLFSRVPSLLLRVSCALCRLSLSLLFVSDVVFFPNSESSLLCCAPTIDARANVNKYSILGGVGFCVTYLFLCRLLPR